MTTNETETKPDFDGDDDKWNGRFTDRGNIIQYDLIQTYLTEGVAEYRKKNDVRRLTLVFSEVRDGARYCSFKRIGDYPGELDPLSVATEVFNRARVSQKTKTVLADVIEWLTDWKNAS